ncbi:MAG: sulfite exporter TauE/SafE family protein [Aureispira sp.]|nr:sulfite exporter TauE/SafE family protein [Aureispira sp.]
MSWEYFVYAGLGGMVAGFLTTLAGLGSVVTLYILIDIIGLPAQVANATNRLGIFAMSATAAPTFHKRGHLDFEKSWPVILLLFIGAVSGFIAIQFFNNEQIREVFKYLLIVMLAVVLINPKRWLQQTNKEHQLNWWIAAPALLAMGFYAGFIQVGTGVFLVTFLVLLGKYSLLDANGVKLAAFALYSLVGILVFAGYGWINWGIGISLALGQGLGAYLTARFATSYPNANAFVHKLLVVVLIVAIFRMFEFWDLGRSIVDSLDI